MWTYVLALLLGAGGAAYGTWQVQEWRWASKEVGRLEREQEASRINERRASMAATGDAARQERIRTEFVTITQEVERVVEKPVYFGQCLDDDGLRILGAAILGSANAASSGPVLP